jgi:hypothetical protein
MQLQSRNLLAVTSTETSLQSRDAPPKLQTLWLDTASLRDHLYARIISGCGLLRAPNFFII